MTKWFKQLIKIIFKALIQSPFDTKSRNDLDQEVVLCHYYEVSMSSSIHCMLSAGFVWTTLVSFPIGCDSAVTSESALILVLKQGKKSIRVSDTSIHSHSSDAELQFNVWRNLLALNLIQTANAYDTAVVEREFFLQPARTEWGHGVLTSNSMFTTDLF